MQPAIRSLQHLSLDDFDYGYFDYDRPKRRIADDHLSGLLTPDTFTVLPPLPPPTPSPPPAPKSYRFTSPTRRQRKASFVILTGPQPLLPGSASSTRIPSPVENKKPVKSRIPRSQPVSREPSPARKRSLNQPKRSVTKKTSVNGNKDASPPSNNKSQLSRKNSVRGSKSAPQSPVRKNSRPQVPRKTSVPGKKDASQEPTRKNSKQQGVLSSPSRIPRPSQSSAGKNNKPVNLGKSLSTTGNKQTVFRKNSNMKPLAGKPPIPPSRTGAGASKTSQKPLSEPVKNDAPTSKPTSKSDVEVSKTETTKTKVEPSKTENGSKPEAEPSKDSVKSQDSYVYVNPTMASAPATTSAPATSTPADQVATSTTSATPAPATSTSTTAPPPPDTSTTIVSITTHPALELAEPIQVETAEPPKSSSAGSKVSATSDPKSIPAESMESVKSEDSGVTVRAASSPHPKKKGVGEEVATSEEFIKGEPDLESLSPNTPMPSNAEAVLRQPGAPSSSVEATQATPTPQSGGRALLSRLCPCFRKLAGPKVAAMADAKTDLPSRPAGKCDWLKRCLCCGCCRKKGEPDGGRRKSIAASQFSKKQSRSSSTAVEPDTRPKLDASLLEQGSMMRGAIPVLPIPLAWICLIFNIIVPGLGTFTSGLFCLCFGKPRFQPRDDPQGRCGAFIVNLIVGASQLFTVIFCLVGWGWSIWWGLIMLRVAKKYKKLKLAEAANQQEERLAAPATQQNHDVERGRPA